MSLFLWILRPCLGTQPAQLKRMFLPRSGGSRKGDPQQPWWDITTVLSNTTCRARSSLGCIWASQPVLQRFCPAFMLLFAHVQFTFPPSKKQVVLDSFSILVYWFLDPSSSFSYSFWILVLSMKMPGGSICNLYKLPFISPFKPWMKILNKTKPKRAFVTLLTKQVLHLSHTD